MTRAPPIDADAGVSWVPPRFVWLAGFALVNVGAVYALVELDPQESAGRWWVSGFLALYAVLGGLFGVHAAFARMGKAVWWWLTGLLVTSINFGFAIVFALHWTSCLWDCSAAEDQADMARFFLAWLALTLITLGPAVALRSRRLVAAEGPA